METNDLLKEILKWQKIQGLIAIRSLIPTLFDSKEKCMVYELSDGTFTRKQISQKAKVATGTISNWWNKWLAEGVLYREGNRYIKIISLKGLSLEDKGGKNE